MLEILIELSLKYLLCSTFKYFLRSYLNFEIFNPMIIAGIIPASDRTEYLPPTFSLCSMKYKLYFFESKFNELFFFSVIIIIFFLLLLIIFNDKRLDNVSIVSPDFEITINKVLLKFTLSLKFKIASEFKLLKKKTFFNFLIKEIKNCLCT